MSTILHESLEKTAPDPQPASRGDAWKTLERVLRPVASLKLTVALFVAGIFIVLVGTLAQVEDDIWKVVRDYFRVDFRALFSSSFPFVNLGELFVWVSPKLFFPPAFAPGGPPAFPAWLGCWFPKGWVIGTLMMVNLFSAHLIRFKVQATGKRLYLGFGVIAVGTLVTFLVIAGGSSQEGLQASPMISYATFWWLLQMSVFGLCALSLFLAITAGSKAREQKWMFGALAVLLGIGSVLAFQFEASNDATMRILYQVVQATFAGAVLLAGCIAVFRKRGGIVLIHAGIGLMMAYDVLVGMEHVESQMHVIEGDTVNFTRDMRVTEIAIVKPLAGNEQDVTVIDAHRFDHGKPTIKDVRLPFDIKVLDYYPNSNLLGPQQPLPSGVSPENPATAGLGKQIRAVRKTGTSGTDTNAGIDTPSMYVQLTDKSGKDLGTYLLSTIFDLNLADTADEITVDGKTYDLSLRFKRIYNDYTVTLKDVQKNNYKGTSQPKDYSSFIVLKDPSLKTEFEHRIWMNNPMRYSGKTFYQSGFNVLENGQEMTTLQVVDNAGWMTPYVACMMVVVGMLYHFGATLQRFLQRRLKESTGSLPGIRGSGAEQLTANGGKPRRRLNRTSWIVTATVVGCVGLAFFISASSAVPRDKTIDGFHVRQFGELPIWYKGRPQPLDSFARNSLMQLSDYQSFKFDPSDKKSQPAILWLLTLMADEDKARDFPVIRIESEDVRNAIGVEARKGFTYSINELRKNKSDQKVIEEATKATAIPAKERTVAQRKTVELANKVIFYSFLERTLGRAPKLPAPEEKEGVDKIAQKSERAQQYFEYLSSGREAMEAFSKDFGLGPIPLVVPMHLGVKPPEGSDPKEAASRWEPLTIVHVYDQFFQEFPIPASPAIRDFISMLDDYKAGNADKFNTDLATYQTLLKKHESGDDLPVKKVNFEAWYNWTGAFNLCSWLYVAAFVLAVVGWLALPQVFERASFWLIALIFVVHTLALIARIYISGRPPVTNLYSSAVFIGWAVVLGGLIMESISRLGIGNVVASAAGFMALRIAHGLAGDGDTFVVLEAVLDTQFWLATHVVCVTLGYATTYLAGLLGLVFILMGVFSRSLSQNIARELTRMIYGVVCFSLFFSFWGTVLGGLWADDSWGRFWGWDPKENGALIIVLWNALILHARWGGMVRDRGIAILAVLGNVVTSWSWFGVNELGVGLHSYGFTEGRLLMLGLFMLSQLLVVAIGLIPRQYWFSSHEPDEKNVVVS